MALTTTADILLLAVLICLSAFFSGSETAIISVSRFRIRSMLQKNRGGAVALQKLKSDPHRTITLVLICNTIVNVSASVIAADIAIGIFGSIGIGIAAAVMTFLLLVFGEITPKLVAQTHADRIALLVARPLYLISLALHPLVLLFNTIPKLFGITHVHRKLTEEDIKTILDVGKEEGTIDQEELFLLKNIFKFDDKTATAIKTPRPEMICIAKGKTIKEFFDLVMSKQHSRIPVYEKNRDNIIGVAYLKEILPLIHAGQWSTPIETMMQKPLFVPPGKKIDELLRLMQRKQQHLTIIVDEFGGVKGLVTMEDILEEIVGDIMDETERIEPYIREESKGWMVLGKTPINAFNKKLKLGIPESEAYDTIGGFLIDQLGRMPKEGHDIRWGGLLFTVSRIAHNRIVEVMMTREK